MERNNIRKNERNLLSACRRKAERLCIYQSVRNCWTDPSEYDINDAGNYYSGSIFYTGDQLSQKRDDRSNESYAKKHGADGG